MALVERTVRTYPTATTTRQTVVTDRPEKYEQKKAIFRAYQLVWFVVGFVEALLAFRILFRMLGANPASGFVSLIYTLSYPFAAPFLTMFPQSVAGRVAIEWSTFVAMIIYYLLALGIVKIFQLAKPTNPVEVEKTIDNV